MKRMLLLVVLIFVASTAFSQSFMHGAGLSIFVGTVKGGDASANWGVTYSPRFNFLETETMSVSVGIPLSVGASGSYNSRDAYADNSLSFMLNAPLIINLNMGAGSTTETESRFGFFAGAGFGYHFGTFSETNIDAFGNDFSDAGTVSSFGPVGNAGIRIAIGESGRTIEVKGSYMKGLDKSKANVFGATALFNF